MEADNILNASLSPSLFPNTQSPHFLPAIEATDSYSFYPRCNPAFMALGVALGKRLFLAKRLFPLNAYNKKVCY